MMRKLYSVLAIFLVFIICLGIFLKYNQSFQQPLPVVNEVVEESKFKKMLLTVIANKLDDEGNIYTFDESSYDEEVAKKYIAFMNDSDIDNIKEADIDNTFEMLFEFRETDNGSILIQKSKETLVLECDDKTTMNALDYELMGLSDSRLDSLVNGFYISQNNPELLNMKYGTSNLKKSGCGLITLTMAINYVNNRNVISLSEVLEWANNNSVYEANAGTRWSVMCSFPPTVSTNSKEVYFYSYEEFANSLKDGEVYITSMKKGNFTDVGHFVLITEVKDDYATVIDCASVCRSLKKWDAKTVFDESKKTFWKISCNSPN